MATLSIAKEFLPAYARLERSVRTEVDKALSMFGEVRHTGLRLKRITESRDPRIRTIRITEFWRGLVLAPEFGDQYVLLDVVTHDQALRLAKRRVFSINTAIGVLEVRDAGGLDDFRPALEQTATGTAARLFDHVSDADLSRLGIDESVRQLARLVTTVDHLLALSTLLPEAQTTALLALGDGRTVDEAWQQVAGLLGDAEPPAEVDTTDLAAAVARTPDRFATVTGPDELAEILAHPFAAWRTFLHSRQRRLAYRPLYTGPALVTGGAGTGKTVTALHRAAFLARRLPDDAPPVLLTTFSRNLSDTLAEQLALLVPEPDIRARIDVRNGHRVAVGIVREAEGANPAIVTDDEQRALWQRAAAGTGGELSAAFLRQEWEQVILAQDLADRDAYLGCERRGRGRKVGGAVREKAWTAIAWALGELRGAGVRTYDQVVADAAALLARRDVPPYSHVIVDEAQDLHPTLWRLLRRAVPRQPDDLFVVGDPNQRIYANRVSLAALGISVRGRSSRLTVNYRTTQEILAWAVRMLAGQPADGLDDEDDRLEGYASPMHGRRPVVRGFADRQSEVDALVERVREWLADGIEPASIGVTGRTGATVRDLTKALGEAGVKAQKTPNPNAVRVDTMHGMKGMEFRCVAMTGVNAGVLPLPAAVTSAAEDPVLHDQDVQRERCLLFVAATRARDALYVSHGPQPSEFLN